MFSGLLHSLLLSISLTIMAPICADAQTSQLLFKSSKPEPKWQNTLEVSNWSAGDSENYDSTEIENTLRYNFNRDYSSTFYLYAGKNWLQDHHSGKPESFLEDPRFSLIRRWENPLRFSLYLPTSDESKKQSRRFTISVQQSVTLQTSDIKLELRAEALYFNTANASRLERIEDEMVEVSHYVYGLFPKAELSWDISKDWSFYAKAIFKLGWDGHGSPKEFYELTFGPNYSYSKTTSVFIQHFSTDDLFNENGFLSQKVSYIGFGVSYEL